MILRTITRHVREQNWFAITIDFFIVVVGVFIGIQVNNWNEIRQNNKVVDQHLSQIMLNVQNTQSRMAFQIAYSDWVKRHITQAIDALNSHSEQGEELSISFLVDAYISGHGVAGGIQRGGFEALKVDGGLSKIRSAELKQRLLDYYNYANLASYFFNTEAEYQKVLRQTMPYQLVRVLRAECGIDADLIISQNNDNKSTFKDCTPDVSEQLKSRALKRFMTTDTLPALQEALSLIESKQPHFHRMVKESEELSAYLRELL